MEGSRRSRRAATLLAVAILAAAGAVLLQQPAAAQDTVEIELVETGDSSAPFAFDPDRLTVEPGTTVRWVHTHDTDHTVTSTDSRQNPEDSGEFHAEFTEAGDTFERTFTETGDHHYYCRPHQSFMRGTVTVASADDGGGGNGSPAAGTAFVVLITGAAAIGLRGRASS